MNWFELAIDKDAIDLDHPISPEERFTLAMAKQWNPPGVMPV